MILLWGPSTDPPLAAVHTALARHSAHVVQIDPITATHCALDMTVDPALHGFLSVDGVTIDLTEVQGVYMRPVGLAQHDVESALVHEGLWAFAEVTTATVLNRPTAMAGNGSKPFQAAQTLAAGFQIPDTLVTTSANAARAFAANYPEVIYKSTSGVRSIVATLDVTDGSRLDDIQNCPTQLQQRIAGTDVRVHVVGQHLFACEIRSDAVDYRYAGREGLATDLRAITLPPTVAARCLALAELTELPLAGIDLRRTLADEWFCFEINPSPGFTYFADATDQPIADAVADLLTASDQGLG